MTKDKKAYILPATKEYPLFAVIVYEFKFDTIRQESYWVAKEVRKYRLRRDAVKFASRFNSDV